MRDMVARAREYTELAAPRRRRSSPRAHLSDGIEEFTVHSPLIAAGRAGRAVRPRAAAAGRRADPADAGRLGRRGRHDLPGRAGRRHQQHRDQRRWRSGRRSPGSPVRSGAPATSTAYDDGEHRGVHRRRPGPAAGLPDHARAPAGREPRHADLRLPQRRPDVLDRPGRAGRAAPGRVRRPARRRLHDQRRHRSASAGFVTGPLRGDARGQPARRGPPGRRGRHDRPAADDARRQRPEPPATARRAWPA